MCTYTVHKTSQVESSFTLYLHRIELLGLRRYDMDIPKDHYFISPSTILNVVHIKIKHIGAIYLNSRTYIHGIDLHYTYTVWGK